MIKNVRLALMLLGLAAVATGAWGATLKVGDKAPKLEVAKWVQGEPVTQFANDKVYIVEFWATWCGPCRQSIPHLNEIHNKFKDKGLIVIGQDCWENDEAEVPKFVKEMGQKMTYRVALDDKNGSEKGKMAEHWMTAADQNGIPTAFLIAKTGEIAWIGHPMTLKEETLEKVLAGNFDVKKAAADYERKKAQEQQSAAVWRNFQEAANAKEWDKAEGLLNDMEKLMDEDDRGNLDNIRLRLALKKNDPKAAQTLAKKLASKEPDNAMYHNEIAWMIVSEGSPAKELIAIAETEANRANELSKGNDASILDTVARVQFVQGDKDNAIKTQQKAVDAANDKSKAFLQKTLDSYKAGKLPAQ